MTSLMLVPSAFVARKTPGEQRPGDFDPTSDSIKVMTMKVSKGLGFPLVALPGVGHMPAKGEDEQEVARVFYVAATRATHRLALGIGGKANLESDLLRYRLISIAYLS